MEGVTREDLRPLLDLQRIDTANDRLFTRKSDLPEQRALDELVVRRTEIAGNHAEQQALLDNVTRDQNKLEGEIAQITNKMEHEQARLYSGDVGNPKELANIQAELDALRRRKVHLEDQELDVMENREGIEADANRFAAELADIEMQVAEATVKRDNASIEIEREMDELAARRSALVPSINAELLELYDSMRPKFGGVAVAALESGTCKGCGLPLSPMAREEIRTTDDPLVRCENCRRLLVVV